MDEIKDFENFYTTKLLPKMERLRTEQKAQDKWGIIGIAGFIAGIAFAYFGMGLHYIDHYGIPVFIGFAIAVFSYIKYVKRYDIFVDDFKGSVIKEIIDHLYPGIIYKPESCISEHEYKASSLFRYYYDDYYGEDYMEGVYKNVSFHCSELETKSESGGSIFKGLFFTAKINPVFNGGTYVWDRDFEQLPVSIMDEEYRLMPMPNVARLASLNKTFSNYFSVCSTIPDQAAQILTAERLQQIVNFKEQSVTNVALSFVAGNCYVAIAGADDLLEPSKYKADDKEEIRIYFKTVTAILDIIDELKLYELS